MIIVYPDAQMLSVLKATLVNLAVVSIHVKRSFVVMRSGVTKESVSRIHVKRYLVQKGVDAAHLAVRLTLVLRSHVRWLSSVVKVSV
jgi:hypothetical protein